MGDFRKLDIWKTAHELTLEVYKFTRRLPDEEKYVLVPQIRRAVISIESNIAEGESRFSDKENVRFFDIARASLAETITQLLIIKDLYGIEVDELVIHYEILGKQITNMIKHRKKSATEKIHKTNKSH